MGVFARWSARRRYFAADKEFGLAMSQFWAPDGDASTRSDALLWMADREQVKADNAFGFYGEDETDEHGVPAAQWFRYGALLLTMVAYTELSSPTRLSDLDDDPAVAEVLSVLSATRDLRLRAEWTLRLYDAVVGRVGGQAAEVLAAVVAQGYYSLSGLSETEAAWRTGPDGRRWQ